MQILEKKSVGIDIADNSIEVAELHRQKDKIAVISLGRVRLNPGVVEKGRIKDEELLLKAVQKAMAQAVPNPIIEHKAVMAIPDSQIYIHNFELKEHNKKEREELI